MAEFTDYESIVRDYITRHRQGAEQELKRFKEQASLAHAVEMAARAQGPDGKHSHQWRLNNDLLAHCARQLLDHLDEIAACNSFDALLNLIEELIGGNYGIGPLMTYDTAHRIGARLGLEPEEVYLHRKTLDGAKALHLHLDERRRRRKSVPMAAFDPPFRKLKPYEVEDCLCFYAEHLRRINGLDR